MSPNSGTTPATPQETALARLGAAQFQDYSTRWLPVQQHLASTIEAMAAPNSAQRQEAQGKGNVDAAQAFNAQENKIAANDLTHGVNAGSSAFKLHQVGTINDEAGAKASGINTGNEAIDKAYLSGLTGLMQVGKGQRATATGSMAGVAPLASEGAEAAAYESNAVRASNYELGGFAAGAAGQYGVNAMRPSPMVPGTQQFTDYNNMLSGGTGGAAGLLENPAGV